MQDQLLERADKVIAESERLLNERYLLRTKAKLVLPKLAQQGAGGVPDRLYRPLDRMTGARPAP